MPASSAPTASDSAAVAFRTTGRVVGGLFLSAFFFYGGGTFLIDSTTGGATAVPENAASLGQLSAGAALLLLNSAAVVTIGALAFRVLRRQHHRIANTYLATRTVEAALLALAPLGTLTMALLNPGASETTSDTGSGLSALARTLVENGEFAYSLAMATLGIGSIFFCRALLTSGLLPRFLAGCGMAAYAIFALGGVLELSGYDIRIMMSVPGALFEVAAGSYLVAKGFRDIARHGGSSTPDTRPTTTTPDLCTANAATRTQPSDAR